MKKQWFFMEDESGFFLPYVLLITTLLFIVTTASIRTYQHEVQITHHLVDRLRVETIIQMGLETFKQEGLLEELDTLNVHYYFPDGEVAIKYNDVGDQGHPLHFTIYSESGLEYTAISPLSNDQ